MRIQILFFLFVFLSLSSCKQSDGYITFESISTKVYYLEEKDPSMDITVVSSDAFKDSFQLSKKEVMSFGFTESYYWIRIDSTNFKNKNFNCLEINNAFIPEAVLYFNEGQEWKTEKSGYTVPMSKKSFKDHHQFFDLPEKKGTYYIRLKPYLHAFEIKLWDKAQLKIYSNEQKLEYGIFIGILLFAIIFNLFLYFSLRRPYYILYSILVSLYLLSSAGVLEGYIIYLFPTMDMMFWYKLFPVMNMPALILFTNTYLNTKKYAPKMNQISQILIFGILAYIVLLLFVGYTPFLMINQILALLNFIYTVFMCYRVYRNGNGWGGYLGMTYMIYFFLLLAEIIHLQTGYPKHIGELSYVSIAIFTESILLGFLLAQRFQREQNDIILKKNELETSIREMEQRFQTELLQSKLEIQEETLKRISQEFHDNIGQNLSFIKINLNLIEQKHPEIDSDKIKTSKDLLTLSIQELRDLTKLLNPNYIKDIGLADTIRVQLTLLEKTGQYKITFDYSGENFNNDKLNNSELIVFRVIQEVLNNIVKHSGANEIIIRMQKIHDVATIEISDNGIGFDLESTEFKKGLGLRNIQERMTLIGGQAEIRSNKSFGTKVFLEFKYQ